jgi:hypothetical protein
MRGFRASRAVQNHKAEQFGRQFNTPHSEGGDHHQNEKPSQLKMIRLKLPEWLRMPQPTENRERDREPNVIPIARRKTRAVTEKAASPAGARKPRKTASATRAAAPVRKRKAA